MKYSKHIIIFSFLAVFTIIACKTKKQTKTVTVVETPKVTDTPKTATELVTYETLKPLLAKSCNISGCHDESHPRMNFKEYNNLKKFGIRGDIDHIVLITRNMPPDEKLTDNELALFRNWLKDGMLEK